VASDANDNTTETLRYVYIIYNSSTSMIRYIHGIVIHVYQSTFLLFLTLLHVEELNENFKKVDNRFVDIDPFYKYFPFHILNRVFRQTSFLN